MRVSIACRNEILTCANPIDSFKGRNEFTIDEVLTCMHSEGTSYTEAKHVSLDSSGLGLP